MKIILPFRDPEIYPLTQKFGEKFYYNGKLCDHQGVDYAMPKYTRIIAPFDGIVERITPERITGYGKAIYFKADDKSKGNVIALLAHLEAIDVEVGYKVKIGQNLGRSGNTGFWRGVNGYHLHFGIKYQGYYTNPLPFMKIHEVDENQLAMFNDEDESKYKSFLGSYVVIEGDNLWNIAKKYYDNGGHYIEIFLANQDILSNPNLIHPGDVLRIPALKNLGI